MRIIAGSLGGRIFASPGSYKTHPMSDKARGALFNTLGDIDGLSVLDAFGGSGALGFEAISRGAVRSIVIDSDRTAQNVIEQNIEALGIGGKVKLVKASAGAWLGTNADAQFDIVLCDPPYGNMQPKLLARLAGHAKPGGVVVYSLPPNGAVELDAGYQQRAVKSYGDAQLVFYQRIS